MPGQMLTPDVYGAETLCMGSLHDPDPSMGSRGLDRLSARRTATLWIVVSHTWALPFVVVG
jgi:hypothetical protein